MTRSELAAALQRMNIRGMGVNCGEAPVRDTGYRTYALEMGWGGPGSTPVPGEVFKRFQQLESAMKSYFGLPLPGVFVSPEWGQPSGISLVWALPAGEISVAYEGDAFQVSGVARYGPVKEAICRTEDEIAATILEVAEQDQAHSTTFFHYDLREWLRSIGVVADTNFGEVDRIYIKQPGCPWSGLLTVKSLIVEGWLEPEHATESARIWIREVVKTSNEFKTAWSKLDPDITRTQAPDLASMGLKQPVLPVS